MSRKQLIAAADELTSRIEEANLLEEFPTELGVLVNKFEWLVHFEGSPVEPETPPVTGAEAHARLMNSLAYVLSGEIVREGTEPIGRMSSPA